MLVKSYCGICRSKTSYLIQRRHYSLLVGISPSDKQRVSTRERLAARWHCMTTLLRRYQLDYNVPCSGSLRLILIVTLTQTITKTPTITVRHFFGRVSIIAATWRNRGLHYETGPKFVWLGIRGWLIVASGKRIIPCLGDASLFQGE